MIDHVDEHFKTPYLHEFGLYWKSLFHTFLKLDYCGESRQVELCLHTVLPGGGV